jgi:hypothetical protein
MKQRTIPHVFAAAGFAPEDGTDDRIMTCRYRDATIAVADED